MKKNLFKNLKLLSILLIVFCCTNSWAKNIYVNNNAIAGDVYCTAIGNDSNSGLTPALPKATLSAAIGIAVNGDVIYIDKGTYAQNTIAINKQITIIGAGTGNTIFDNGNAAQLWAEITSSNVSVKNLTLTKFFNANGAKGQVININGAFTNVTLDGILITACLGASATLPNIHIAGGANVTIKNSFLKCSGYNGSMGGGILVNSATVLIDNTVFYQNESATATENGGGLQVKGATANVTVTNCTFNGCVSLKGGAIGQNAGTLSVSGSCFSNNISETDDNTSGGGAIFVNGTSNTTISNCNFDTNAATAQAKGTTSIVVGTATSADGAAICFKSVTGTASITNCSFSNNGKLLQTDGQTLVNPFDDGQDIYYSGASLNITISNNTFSTATTGEVNIFEDASGNQTMSNNGIYTQTGSTSATTNAVPTRTDVAGFGTWTDTNVTGTTVLNMLSGIVAFTPTRTAQNGFTTWTDTQIGGTTSNISMINNATTNYTPTRTDVYSTCSTVVFAGWADTNIGQGGTCATAINTSGCLTLLTPTSSTISPTINLSAGRSKFLSFRARTFNGTNTTKNTITVSISTDNGATWSVLGTRVHINTTLTTMAEFDLSAYNSNTVKIKFESLAADGSIGVGIDDITIAERTISTVVTPTLDFTGFNTKTLNFKAAIISSAVEAKNTITVSASSDNGVTWTVVGTRFHTTITSTAMAAIDLSAYTGNTIKLKFETLAADGTIGAAIDDIAITGEAKISTTVSPLMDLTGNAAQVVYTHANIGTNAAKNTITVSVSTNGGTTWSILGTSNTTGIKTFSLDGYISNQVKVKFEALSADGTIGASIDAIDILKAASANALPIVSCVSPSSISSCSVTINCTTESIAPVIISCVPNKTLPCPATLPDYTSEVNAYDDCSFTVIQSPLAGTSLPFGNTTVTMTVTDLKGNFSTCTFTVTVSSGTPATNFGDFASAVGISTNGGTSASFYNTSGSAANLIGSSTFTAANLGSYSPSSGTLKLTGAELKTFKSGTGNVCGGTLFYVVYTTGSRPAVPVFQSFAIPFANDCSGGTFPSGGPCTTGDQKWSTSLQSIDLTAYAAGSYTIEAYYAYTGSDTGGCGTTQYLNNSCSNYTATFTLSTFSPIDAVVDTPSVLAGGSTPSVLNNDTFNGVAATTSNVTLSVVTIDSHLTLNTDGTVTVAPGTPAGNYTLTYSICDKVNPSNCDTVQSTVTVTDLQTVAGTITADQNICKDSNPNDLLLTGNTGSVIKWQKSADFAFTTPIDIPSTSTTLSGSLIGSLATTTYFRAVVQNGTSTIEYSNVVTITVPSTTWNGTSWSNGEPTITTTAYMTGNYSLSTDIFACTLTVSNNAIVSIPSGYDVTLYGKLTVNTGSSFTLNNNSNLIQQTNVSNTGDITVKRMTSPIYRLDYTLWSSPVIGSQTLFNFSPLTSNIAPTNIRFYIYNTLTNQYNSVNPVTTTFNTAKGYLIRSPNNWLSYNSSLSPAPQKWTGSFTGVPRNGDVNFTMVNTGTNTAINATGNPYPSAILLDNFINDNSSNIEGTLWFWRKYNDNDNLVSYSTCSTIGCALTNNATYTDSNLISIGQGFMVKAKTGQTNLNFTNSMRSSENVNQFFKSSPTQMDRYWIKMTNSTNVSAGQNLIAYVPNATNDYNSGLDGLYSNDSSVAFYSKAGTQDVVINARPSFVVSDVLPLIFKTNVSDTYTFSLNQREGIFNGTQDVLLRDNYTNFVQNLSQGDYSFTSAIGTFSNRFDIIYQNTLGVNNSEFNSNQVVIYNQDNITHINSGNIKMNSLKIFDVQGRLLFNKSGINDTKTSLKLGFESQMLLFQITSQDGETVTKKVIN
ncbi:HYR domain-containing protein [Flavobacterium sp.]|jgi:hypothetical protein|uniref:HYR domain-containing protein n=1 Tax=Flavobacterium sp. TaxID=239 RepID=UPI0037BF25EF